MNRTTPEHLAPSSSSSSPPWLFIEDGDGRQRARPLDRDAISVGRSADNDVRLEERNVSRHHVRLLREDDAVFVEELEARYGTRLGDAPLEGRARLEAGVALQVGDCLLRIGPPPAASRAAPLAAEGPAGLIPEAARGELVVVSSTLAGERFALARAPLMVGRGAECDLVLDDASVSREQALIEWDEADGYALLSLSDTNPVALDGQPQTHFPLREGDVLTFGRVRLRFRAPGSSWQYVPRANGGRAAVSAPLPAPRAPSPRGLQALLVALVLVVIAGAAGLIALWPEPPEGDGGAAPVADGGVALPEDAALMARACLEATGDPEQARALCTQALALRPGDAALEARLRAAERARAHAATQAQAEAALASGAAGDCARARTALAGLEAPAPELARRLEACVVAAHEAAFAAALARSPAEALAYVAAERAALPAALAAALEARARAAEATLAAASPRTPRTPRPPETTSAPPEASADREARAEALAAEALEAILRDPRRAVKRYEEALRLAPSSDLRARYAYALERAQRPCDAYREYAAVVERLSGSQARKARRFIQTHPECQ